MYASGKEWGIAQWQNARLAHTMPWVWSLPQKKRKAMERKMEGERERQERGGLSSDILFGKCIIIGDDYRLNI